MKAVILAGGLGTRLAEETGTKPKPMVEIGGKPILWHIMKYYSHFGINDFIICCGYKGYMIKEYFHNYLLHQSDLKINLKTNSVEYTNNKAEDWNVQLIDTGLNTMTGGRLKRVYDYIKNEKFFFFTYGDGLSNIDIKKSLDFHLTHGKEATVSAVFAPGRFGALDIDNGSVRSFKEKPKGDGARINGGYFILSPSVVNRIEDDNSIWEQKPLQSLAIDNQLGAFLHDDFWQPMDTLREKQVLEQMWNHNKAPWKLWK